MIAEQSLLGGYALDGNRAAAGPASVHCIREDGRAILGCDESHNIYNVAHCDMIVLGRLRADSVCLVAYAKQRAGPLQGHSAAQMHTVKRITDLVPAQ